MKKLPLILLLISLQSNAQTFRATVCDSLSKQALPSASVRVKNTNLGTTTNADGRFSLLLKKSAYQFIISYIGYTSKVIEGVAMPDTIFLSEDNRLNEVVVMPDSALRVLLKNAYKNISKNYPQQPNFLTGFYREVNESVDSSRFNYFSESMLKIYKPPYTLAGSEHQGQVQVLKTRKVMHPNYEKQGAKFYGGPYAAIRYDEVLKRSDFINPKFYKKYDYELEKITSFDGKPVYVIAFSYRDSVFNGKIYIDKTDLAYIKFETYKQQNKKELTLTRLDRTEKVIFDKKDDVWYLKYCKGMTKFKSEKEYFNLSVEYVTTSITQDSIKSFTYDQEFNLFDIIARQETKISDDFFKEYNSVLDQTQDLKNQLDLAFNLNTIDSLKNINTDTNKQINFSKPTAKKSRSQANPFTKILSHLNVGLSLTYVPIQSDNYTFSAAVNDVFSDTWRISTTTKSSNLPLLLHGSWSYRLNKRWLLLYAKAKSFKNLSNTSVDFNNIGIAYHFVLNRAKRPIIVEPSIKYTNMRYGVSFGKIENPMRGVEVDDVKLNTKSIIAGIYQKTEGIKLGVSTSIYARKTMKLYLNLDYLYPITTSKPYFQLRETDRFFKASKVVNLDVNDRRVKIQDVNTLPLPKINDNFWIGFTWQRGL